MHPKQLQMGSYLYERLEWLDGVDTLLWKNRYSGASLRRGSYTDPCSACPTLTFPHRAAPNTCPFPTNRLAGDVNTVNQIPLTTGRACFSRWSVQESSAPHIAPERTQLFFLSGALKSISDYRLRGGMEKSGTRKLPVIWQLKAIARGDGSGCNQGVWRPSAYDREEHDGYLRVTSISSRRLLSSQQNS